MNTAVFYTENAGLYLNSGQTGILIDSIHEGERVGYAPMRGTAEDLLPELGVGSGTAAVSGRLSLRRDTFGFGQGAVERPSWVSGTLDGVLCSHLHMDHCDQEKIETFLRDHPETAFWAPGLMPRGLSRHVPDPKCTAFTIGDFRILAYRTVHSGPAYRDIPHHSMLIENESSGERFLNCTDAVLDPDRDRALLEDASGVDAVFVMLYQLIERTSLAFLKELNPGRVFLYHLMPPDQDNYNYLPMARKMRQKSPLPGKEIEILIQHIWVGDDTLL